MHVRRKKTWLQTAADRVSDPDWRAEIIDQASTKATQLASDVAQRSTDLTAQVSEKVSDVAHNVSGEAHSRLAERTSPPKKRHWVRNLVLLSGAGAAAAYFMDSRRRSATPKPAAVPTSAATPSAAVPEQSARTDDSARRDSSTPIS